MASIGEDFGTAVATARKAQGMTVSTLAEALFGSANRAAFVARIEAGEVALSRGTLEELCVLLGVSQPDSAADLPATDAVTPEDDVAATLLLTDADAPEGLRLTLANAFARAPHDSLTIAIGAMSAALEAAQEFRTIAGLAPTAADPILALTNRISTLNDNGKTASAAAEVDAVLAGLSADQTLHASALTEIALRQDRICNTPDRAAKRVLGQLRGVAHPGGLFKAMHDAWEGWFDRGSDQSLPFDLNVALHIARANLERSKAVQRRQAMGDLGITQYRLGEVEGRAARLSQAVATFRSFLAEQPRKADPEAWAVARVNLGIALKSLGSREADTAHLIEAVASLRAALEVQTRAKAPLDWAHATGHMAEAMSLLADRTGDLELATAALHQLEAAEAAAAPDEADPDRLTRAQAVIVRLS